MATDRDDVRVRATGPKGNYDVLIDGVTVGFVCRNHRYPCY